MKQKKGIQLGQAFGAVLALVLVAVLVIVAIYLFTTLGSSMMAPGTTGTVINESVANPNGASSHVQAVNLRDGTCGTFTKIYNGTGGIVMTAANFTQTGCTFTNATSMAPYSSTLLISYPYTYTADTAASNATDNITTQFGTYPTLVGLVGTIIFLALVIGVLVSAFAFSGKKGM